MNGGRISGLFNSIFGELLLDKDCANILEDPNADQMDKYDLIKLSAIASQIISVKYHNDT